jgi:predicted dehydrogenase
MVRLGIIGTGLMAGVISECAHQGGFRITSVLSRTESKALKFCCEHGLATTCVYSDINSFFRNSEVDAVYIATPTSVKEKFLSLCISYGKHVLIEKPLPQSDTFISLLSKARDKGLIWLDATHFIHNDFYKRIDDIIANYVGRISRIEACFHWPDEDKGQIKFDQRLEPDGALGDLGWYPLRLLSTFINPEDDYWVKCYLRQTVSGTITEATTTGLISDAISFSFSCSYNSSVVRQSCLISGERGEIFVPDFIMPYSGSFVYGSRKNDMIINYRSGYLPLLENESLKISFNEPQHISMLKSFSEYILSGQSEALNFNQSVCIRTIHFLRNVKVNADSIFHK